MNTPLIRRLVRERSGARPTSHAVAELTRLEHFLSNEDISQYLQSCLPEVIYRASEVRVLDLDSIKAEMVEGAAPGGYIGRFGYLVIATDVSGNAICAHHPTSRVFWADHESFTEDHICYEERPTGRWTYVYEYNAQNIEKACVLLSESFEHFLIELLSNRLTGELDALD